MVMVEVPNKEEFEKSYFEGLSFGELADKYFVSMSTIYTWVRKFNLDRTKMTIIENGLKELFHAGFDSKYIAKVFKSNEKTIKKYIENYGLDYVLKIERTKNNVPRKSYVLRGTK